MADVLRGAAALAAALGARGGRGRKRGARISVSPPEERRRGSILFASKAEAARFDELTELKRSGALRPPYFLLQVPFLLPGRTRYRLDFLVFWADGSVGFEDVKGHRTETYALKKRQVEELYGVKIEERRPERAPRYRRAR